MALGGKPAYQTSSAVEASEAAPLGADGGGASVFYHAGGYAAKETTKLSSIVANRRR